MRYLHGRINDYEITVVIYDENKPCLMSIRLIEPWNISQVDGEYANARMLSSDLACQIGYGPACDFMHANNVPKDSSLWFLNHQGWSPPNQLHD